MVWAFGGVRGVAGGLGVLWVQGVGLHSGGHLPPPNWSRVSHLYVERVQDLKPPTRTEVIRMMRNRFITGFPGRWWVRPPPRAFSASPGAA